MFTWIDQSVDLSPTAMTIRAQTIEPGDAGNLLFDAFFPRAEAPGIEIDQITGVDFRPVSDRREWNQRGRMIHAKTPSADRLEMVPIEAFFKIGEYEMQKLAERTGGDEQRMRELMQADIPGRVDGLAQANLRRIEVDAFTAWALGQITARNPQTGQAYTFSLGFSADRYQTVATAWSDAAVNAYDEFISWLADAIDAMGAIDGVMLRLADLQQIQADAPNFYSPDSSLTMTRAQLTQRVQDEIGSEFTFYTNEESVDIYGDAGVEPTRTKVWPTGVIAAVPAGERVGNTHFAPVVRAYELSAAEPEAQIDVRGQTVFYETGSNGRELTCECQVNAFPLPAEDRAFVLDITP